MNTRSIILIGALAALTVSLALPANAAPIAEGSGDAMCAALTPADFAGVGVTGASKPHANVPDRTSAYCVYAGKSSATGGIEFDIFYPAGANDTESKATEATAMGESGRAYQKIALSGADDAQISTNLVSGGPPFAGIIVRKGNLVFVIGIPTGKQARDQLLKLATIALKRL